MRKTVCCPDLAEPLLSRESDSLLPYLPGLHLGKQECSIPAAAGVASHLQDALKDKLLQHRLLSPLYSLDRLTSSCFQAQILSSCC